MNKIQQMSLVLERRRIRWAELTPQYALSRTGKIVPAHGFVYVFGARNLVKIGMTKFGLYRRWHSIQTNNPWLEPPLYVSPPLLSRVARIEQECHAALDEYRRRGEWFECDRTKVIYTVRSICNGQDG